MVKISESSARLNLSQFETRKKSHLELAVRADMQAIACREALDRMTLEHDALPELDFSSIRLASPFLTGKSRRELATPFFVCGMTAGHAGAARLNHRLAAACARRGWIFGVGSQRRELAPSGRSSDEWGRLKANSPGLVVLGNLGISEVISESPEAVRGLAGRIEADAFCVHLNALQEVLQPEGKPEFRGGLAALRKLTKRLGVPLILKETGCGFSRATLEKIRTLKLAAVDVSGAGGTHWGRIEGVRARQKGDERRARAAVSFANWGISTVESVRLASMLLPKSVEIWASGGVRDGLDAAKLISLGAHRVGFAKAALEAATEGEDALDGWMDTIEFELKTALFCTGHASPSALRERRAGR